MVPLHPSFDTVTWLAYDPCVFERVGATLLPDNDFAPSRLLVSQEAWDLADPKFTGPLQRVRDALAVHLKAEPEALRFAVDMPLEIWRQTYVTAGAHEGWAVHGAWIKKHRPPFGPAIEARWRAASGVSDEDAQKARASGRASCSPGDGGFCPEQ